MLKSELLGSSVGEKPPSELERGDEAAFSDRIGGERGIDRERRTKVLHPSRGWEYPDRAGMAKTEIPVEMMTCNSEQVVNLAVDREKSLNLCRRFETTQIFVRIYIQSCLYNRSAVG